MRNPTPLLRKYALLQILPFVSLALFAGCGGDSAKPKPELDVMGAIQMTPADPQGGPYGVGVVVSVGGKAITDATVTVNNVPLVYNSDPSHPDQTGYVGLVPLTVGQAAELKVSCSAGEKTLDAVTPGFAQILSPTMGSVYADSEDVRVTWTPAAHSVLCVLTCAGADTKTPAMWMLEDTASIQVVPASFTSPPGNALVLTNLNGQGDLPSADLRAWVGLNGFWATSESIVNIQVQ